MNDSIRQLVKPLASLKLTVVLLTLSMVLVFAGTWAQIDLGIWTVLKTYFRTWYVFIPFQVFLPRGWNVTGGIPFPGGYIVGGLLLVNLLSAHVVRFRMRATGNRLTGGLLLVALWGTLIWWMTEFEIWDMILSRGGTALLLTIGLLCYVPIIAGAALLFDKRCGIMLIHAALILLLVGELVTALGAHEANMSIDEGQTVNFTENIHQMELAVIDPSHADHDEVVIVPQTRLKAGRVVTDPLLPFDIQIDEYMFNSQILGPFQISRSDRPDRKPRATRGLAAFKRFVVEALPPVSGVGSNTIDAPSALITLYDKGRSLGTWLVSLHIVGPQLVEVGGKTYHIALRFRREYKEYSLQLSDFRFDRYIGTQTPRNYSSQVRLIDPSRDEDRQVLIYMNHPLRYRGETFYQASYKPDEKTTILQVVRNPGWLLPYIACTIGGIGMLIHFGMQLLQFVQRRAKTSASSGGAPIGAIAIVSAIVFGLLALPITISTAQRGEDDAVARLGRAPVVDQGRIKPLDTLARVSLMVLSNKQSWYTDGEAGGAEREGMDKPQRASAMQWLLDVMAQPNKAQNYKVFRIDHPEVLALIGEKPEQRKYFSYHEIMAHAEGLEEQMTKARRIEVKDRTLFQSKLADLSSDLGRYTSLEDIGRLFLIPPTDPGGEWQRLGDAYEADPDYIHVAAVVDALGAWNRDQSGDFSAAVGRHFDALETNIPDVARKINFETFFNRAAPFYNGTVIYVFAFLAVAFSGLFARRPLSLAAFGLIIIALVLHTYGLAARVYIQGRPPVTNLYSSAVFVGWGAVILGAILERIYRNGIGAATASVIGFVTLIIAHNLALEGDTMTMMQAVLDTNFWLATHVVVITLGYSATFLAGFLAIVYIIRGLFTTTLVEDQRKSMARMIYGIVAFAALFSFVGTILGGIWADQSWGRFWGWDPKENGALLIVLWNALVLHARWGGIVRERGIATLAVAGNIVTAWSWFGTNMLGVGLHSYGFMDKALWWLLIFIASQMVIIAIGLLPLDWWWSIRAEQLGGHRSPAAMPEPAA